MKPLLSSCGGAESCIDTWSEGLWWYAMPNDSVILDLLLLLAM
jgi:hypothetical protein